MTPRKIICHADGDRCLGCAHYQGKADVCEFAKDAIDEALAASVQAIGIYSIGESAADETERLRNRVNELTSAFRHVHKVGPNGGNCSLCGLDVRDPIHLRVGE